jgi:hypothetical protein
MAEPVKYVAADMATPVKYVALRVGFVDGRMVAKGDPFFWSGKPPKWAKPASEMPVIPEEKPIGGDTKPAAAQAAVKRKAEGLPSKGTAS